MADTRENISVPKGVWTNLYAVSGIAVGTRIRVENTGTCDAYLAVQAGQPSPSHNQYNILKRNGPKLSNNTGDAGAWAFCNGSDGEINVSIDSNNGFNEVTGGGLENPASMPNSDGKDVQTNAIGFIDNIAFVDSFGQLVCDKQVSNVSVNFANGLFDEIFDVKAPETTGDGATTASNGYAEVSSAASGTAEVESRDSVRYSNGRGFFTVFTASFEGDGVGWAGGFDNTDGFPLRFTGSTDTLEFGHLESGVFSGVVDIDHSALGLDSSKINIWAVLGGFLGVANPVLLVKMDTWKLAGTIRTEGRLTETHTRLPAFPMKIRAENGMTVKSGSWHAGTIGTAEKVQDRGFSYPNQIFTNTGDPGNPPNSVRGRLTLSGTDLATAFILHSKLLYNGLPNKVKADVIGITIDITPSPNSGTIQVQLVGNPSGLSPSPSYSDISPSSVLEIDDSPDAEATGQYQSGTSTGDLVGEPININYTGSGGFFGTSQGGSGQTLVDELSLDGIADETLALLIRDLDGNGVTILWNITWIERQI